MIKKSNIRWGVIAVINLLVLLIVVFWQANLTRSQQLAVSDYSETRRMIVDLRNNIEDISNLCQTEERSKTSGFYNQITQLNTQTRAMLARLVSIRITSKKTFNAEV